MAGQSGVKFLMKHSKSKVFGCKSKDCYNQELSLSHFLENEKV